MFPVCGSSPTAALAGPAVSLCVAASLIQQCLPPRRISGQYSGLGSKVPDPKFPAPARFAARSCCAGRCDGDGSELPIQEAQHTLAGLCRSQVKLTGRCRQAGVRSPCAGDGEAQTDAFS